MPVFDTTFLVDLMRSPRNPRHAAARRVFSDVLRGHEVACTTRLNVAELWVGIEMLGRPEQAVRTMRALLDGFVIIDFDDVAARRFGQIEAFLRQKGSPVGEMDTLIASVCLTHGQRIITRDVNHFLGVPGLVVETY